MPFLLLFGFLAASVPLLASTDENRTLQVRTVVKIQPPSDVAESRPGASDLPKTGGNADATPSFLRPKIVHIPKPEVSDADE